MPHIIGGSIPATLLDQTLTGQPESRMHLPDVLDTDGTAEFGAMVWIDGLPSFLQLELALTFSSPGITSFEDVHLVGAAQFGDLTNRQCR